MRSLTLLHRWAGGIVGLLLAVLGLSGTLLVWEESWIGLPGAEEPYRSTTGDLARAVEAAATGGRELSRITFADDGMGLHLAIYTDGGGAYVDQAGRMVDSWNGKWGRPELWLFDLHHYLLVGEIGETIAGVLGLLLIGFVVSGAVLWWRTRRTFELRLWPRRMTRSAIIRQHRDIGIIASPVLLVSAATGALMIFSSLSDGLFAPWAGSQAEPAVPEIAAAARGFAAAHPDYAAIMAAGQAAFPGAMPRRLTVPAEPGTPINLRLRQSFEWTPNGRSYAYLDPTGKVVGIDDPRQGDARSAIQEKLYPLHSGKVGGPVWKLVLTLGGLTLVLLGTLATWSFWFARKRPVAAFPAMSAAVEPAE